MDKNTERVYIAWQYLGVVVCAWALLISMEWLQ